MRINNRTDLGIFFTKRSMDTQKTRFNKTGFYCVHRENNILNFIKR